MRILVLTPRLPYPPNRGDRSRVFHFIKHLSNENELTLVSFIAHESEQEHLPLLQRYCQHVHVVRSSPARSALSAFLNLWRPEPLQALYYRSAAMRRLVDKVLADGQFEVAYVHLFRMAPYVAARSDLYRVIDLTDAISQEISRSLPYRSPIWRLIYRFEGPRIERYERWAASTFEEAWMISEADLQVLAQACPGANIRVVPIGVDGDQFYPTGQPSKPNSLILVGHMRVFHNIDAATHLTKDILPRVRRQIPDCSLEIVGAEPGAQVQRLASAQAVTVTGFVPDLNAHLNRAAVFVAPLRFCAGLQTKVLEAMATARPVVTTSVVNRGVGAQPGREILIADDVQTMAEQIVTLLQNGDLRAQIGEAGLCFVRHKYTWQSVVERMKAVDEILAAEQAGTKRSNEESE